MKGKFHKDLKDAMMVKVVKAMKKMDNSDDELDHRRVSITKAKRQMSKRDLSQELTNPAKAA